MASPSHEAAEALTLADLLPKLLASPGPVADPRARAAGQPSDRTRDDWRIPAVLTTRGTYEVSTRDYLAELYCRVHGRAEAGVRSWIGSSDYRGFEFPEPTFGLGVGALGPTREQAAPRLGEIVAAAARSPICRRWVAQVPDFDIGLGGRAPKVHLISGLVCSGGFSLLKRFSSPSESEPIPLSGSRDAWAVTPPEW